MGILYHEYGVGDEYDTLGHLTNNWNPDLKYPDNEYATVYFRVNTPSYDSNNGWNSNGEKAVVKSEINKLFRSLGWSVVASPHEAASATARNKKQGLYTHPMEFSGTVLKNNIKQIAEAIKNAKTFTLRWVDIYDTVYDITDKENKAYLDSRQDEIRKALFEKCKTNRRTTFCIVNDVCAKMAKKFGKKRIDSKDQMAKKYIRDLIHEMADEKLLILDHNREGIELVRTPNKTEQKKLKINFK